MIKKLTIICGLAVAFAAMSAGVAQADGMDSFTYVSDGNTFVWQLPSSPTPDSIDPFGDYFTISVDYSENGAVPVLGTFDFFVSGDLGGFDLYPGMAAAPPPFYLVNAVGSQLFTGSLGAPTFLTGNYSGDTGLTDFAINQEDGLPGSLTIAGVAGVPEPSTAGLLAVGLLVLGLGFGFKKTASQT